LSDPATREGIVTPDTPEDRAEEPTESGAQDRPGELTDAALVTLLRRLVLESDRFAEIFGERHRIHRTDLNALAVIMHAGAEGRSVGPRHLADALHLSPSAVTALVDRLEAAGHLHRDRSPGDRRRVELRVHDQALTLGRAYFGPLGEELTRAWADFGDDERAVIARFLARSIDSTTRIRRALVDPGR
jgi:DNA-binding MarR family transcriptional regulator